MRGAIDGGTIWWVAPTYPIASLIWHDLKRACKDGWESKSESERLIVLPGGGSIAVKSSDNPDSLRGAGLDGVVLDEAAMTKETAWRQALRPALTDKQGWATFIGTPKGFNWFHDLFQQAAYQEGWARWQRPTSDNVLVDAAELVLAKIEIGSAAYSQEHDALFVADGLGMFHRDWLPIVEGCPSAVRAVRYWDKAGTTGGGDFSAGVLMLESGGLFYVADVVRGQWSSHERNRIMAQTAALDAQRYPDLEIWTEQEPGSGGKESAEHTIRQLAGYAVFAERSTGTKVVRAGPLSGQAQAGNVRLVAGAWNRDYIDELTAFPFGAYDDQVDASSGAFAKLAMPVEEYETHFEFLGERF